MNDAEMEHGIRIGGWATLEEAQAAVDRPPLEQTYSMNELLRAAGGYPVPQPAPPRPTADQLQAAREALASSSDSFTGALRQLERNRRSFTFTPTTPGHPAPTWAEIHAQAAEALQEAERQRQLLRDAANRLRGYR